MPLGATLSIVAVDKRSGAMGAAVLSQSFSVGSRTIWSEPGIGVVVAQGTIEPTYGPLGLALLKGGKTPPQALKSLLATDPRPGVRQVTIIDSRGRVAAHTGKSCLPEAGYLAGRGFSVQANFVNAKRVWRSMAAAFRGAKGTLAERMVSALEAGEQASKGRRGGSSRSAAVTVVAALPTNTPWEGRLLDLRVESSDAPVKELKGLLKVEEAYGHAASGEELLSKGDIERGGREFSKAVSLAPRSSEVKLWFALLMLGRGEFKTGEPALRSAVGRGRDVKALLRELAARGIVDGPPEGQPEVREA
ncbi:MAG TPA: DUF1028 domain-containing protein [Nitrososphaerales archaeon]|nr:DUF1028 domain-containing protein [Nitrososphaerales archaeon]